MINMDITSVNGGDPESARLKLRIMSMLFEAAPRAVVQAAAEVYKAKLKEKAPRGKGGADDKWGTHPSGRLAESHIYRTTPLGRAMFGARFMAIKYAMWVIQGTPEHDIWAGAANSASRPWGVTGGGNWKKALYWQGAPHPFVKVHHPGTKPNDYREAAAEAAVPEVAAILRAAGIAVAKRNPGIYAPIAKYWAGTSSSDTSG